MEPLCEIPPERSVPKLADIQPVGACKSFGQLPVKRRALAAEAKLAETDKRQCAISVTKLAQVARGLRSLGREGDRESVARPVLLLLAPSSNSRNNLLQYYSTFSRPGQIAPHRSL